MRRAQRPGWRSAGRCAVALVACAVALGATAVPANAIVDDQWWHVQWRMDEVWQITDGSGATVAVLDTGVRGDTPELAGALLPGADYLAPGADGWTDHDESLHGTGVAVTIAGNGQGRGLRGVAPGARILPVAVMESSVIGQGSRAAPDAMSEAIRWAVDNGADIINMSFSSNVPCDLKADAYQYALRNDVILVSSAGNSRGGSTLTPARCPEVLTVGATGVQMEPWADTHQTEHVDVAAPGVQLPALGPGGQLGYGSGTSLSAALVSGVLALLRSEFPDAPAEELVARLIATSRDVHTTGWDDLTGYGLVRPYHALTESEVPPDTPSPPFDALAAAQHEPSEPGAPAPGVAQPPASDNDGGGGLLGLIVAVAGIVLVASVIALLLLVRRRAS